MQYKKPPFTIEKQIKLLKKRGLIINDEKKVEKYLRNISYYHLSIYFKHFQKDDSFIGGVTFDDVLNVYVFDQKLRLLILDVLERLEKSFKCRLVYEISVNLNSSFWLSDNKLFKNKKLHKERVVGMLNDLKNSKEVCVTHYYQKYNKPVHPPAWIVLETLTFGQAVMIYNILIPNVQKVVAKTYDINKRFITNWMFALSSVRNLCAHHSRLWNKDFIVRLDQGIGLYKNIFHKENSRNRLFNYLIVMQVINCKYNSTSKWNERLEEIIIEHEINISHMGFPNDWKERFEKVRDIQENI